MRRCAEFGEIQKFSMSFIALISCTLKNIHYMYVKWLLKYTV